MSRNNYSSDEDKLLQLVGLETARSQGNRGRANNFNSSNRNQSLLSQTRKVAIPVAQSKIPTNLQGSRCGPATVTKIAVPVARSKIPQYLGSSYAQDTTTMGRGSQRPYAPTSRLPGPSAEGPYRQEEPAHWKSSYKSYIPVSDGSRCECTGEGVYTSRPHAPESYLPYPPETYAGAFAGPGNFNVVPGRSEVGRTYSRDYRAANPPFKQTQKVSLQGPNRQPPQDFNSQRDILNQSYKGIPYYEGVIFPEIIHFDWERRQSN